MVRQLKFSILLPHLKLWVILFWSKIEILVENRNFSQKSKFSHIPIMTIFKFWPEIDFWSKFRFFAKIMIFDQKYDFLPKIRFFTKNTIFDQNFDVWQSFDIIPKFRIVAQICITHLKWWALVLLWAFEFTYLLMFSASKLGFFGWMTS